jgi:AraC family transcriptional regulator of adaptative response/methylated-DNA-[protein]-cysteine methyltransferase
MSRDRRCTNEAEMIAAQRIPLPAPSQSADDPRWAAIATRDASADGTFVFSVRSTGVYCRPSCPARPARRENVAFHATCDDAERAGFRACKRCRPNEASQTERHAAAVARTCRLIEAAEALPTLPMLAEAAGLSAHHFHRVFKRVTGVTPKAYGNAHRAARLAADLPRAQSVTTAIYDAGYNASSRFYESSNARLGMTPKTYREGGRGQKIRFAVGACSLGAILVAATDKGICAILIGDDPDALVRDLQDRFAKAALIGGDKTFETTVAQVVGFVEAPRIGLDLPLDIGGTAFQQRVWQALQAIPVGTTASYTDVARAIGLPSATRAVAGACGANPIAVAIPCHRVVRADGGLSGYRWGIERKKALLDREAGPGDRALQPAIKRV